MTPTRHTPRLLLMFALVMAFMHPTARALDIILVPLDPPSGEDNHTLDPDAALLSAIFTEAAQRWEDIIEDEHTLTLKFRWDDLDSTTLALHQLNSQSAGRETQATISFDTFNGSSPRNWFFDPTPALDEEFDFTQTLYRDLSSSHQSAYYSTPAPGVLEAGYVGSAPSGTEPFGNVDLLGVAMHEIGHALGMSGANTATKAETSDNDYDSPALLLAGASVGIKTASSTNIAHLANTKTLMYPFTSSSKRTLPSASDVFAAAAASNWSQIDLPRQDFLGGTDFHTPANWTANQLPDPDDRAYVRPDTPAAVTLSAPTTLVSLSIANGSSLDTAANDLTIADATTVDNGSTVVIADATLNTAILNIDPAATFTLDNATLVAQTVNGPLTNTAGTIAPGTPTFGTTTIDGSYTQGPSANFTVDLATPADVVPVLGEEFDQLAVTGPVSLGGTLDLHPTPDPATFAPDLGVSYTVMTFETRTIDGIQTMFDTITGALIDTGLALAPSFTDTDLVLRVSVPGDLNFDDAVSVADLATFALNFGTSPGLGNWHLGDLNSDGAINTADLSLLAANFGFDASTSTPALTLSVDAVAAIAGLDLTASIPEPATVSLFGAAVALGFRPRRPDPRRWTRP